MSEKESVPAVYLTPKSKREIADHQMQTVGRLQARFPDAALEHSEFRGEVTIVVKPEAIVEIAKFVRDTPELLYRHLADVTCVDYLQLDTERGRFAIVYHLYSFKYGDRIRLKAFLPEQEPRIDSLVPVWQTANWLEREVYDMFGIVFRNHPDLRRILMPEDSVHFPLRKDYPLTGRGERESFPYVTRDGRIIEKSRSPRAR
ncbi:MAG: NADH-quinone oxidoreductase subunit C [Candidatus Abyssobacteria bacterium SURF_17]|uniref:NADH-quinone oxidoreductase subunit C n=1 Tax=Candidatus Abyssobacteria bacterium SURF_17 TaxID=2093361 RepID=A0A419EY15_9BACT|nr:MAG: NADH-quinone oxidoreductase subunit C [Candidatus Abyssubacteria bacterium SURF_17]